MLSRSSFLQGERWHTVSKALGRVGLSRDYFDPVLGSRGQPSERVIICVRPVGGDVFLADEVIPLSEDPNLAEAYRVIEEIQANGVPQQKISADAFECAVVDEFGSMLAAP